MSNRTPAQILQERLLADEGQPFIRLTPDDARFILAALIRETGKRVIAENREALDRLA